jgi:RHS repeat-associated protein
VDGVLGETVNYTYDALNRLATAQATNNSWGNAYTYDGFGNLTGSTVTAGTAPHFSMNIDPTTNRIATSPGYYDANGNPGYSLNENQYLSLYDVENRTLYENSGVNIYDPSGKRVAQVGAVSGQPNQLFYFYGLTGQRLGTYGLSSDQTTFSTVSLNVYFGGKLIRSGGFTAATDRLGSVRGRWTGTVEQMAYWPYGQERTSTADWREKFATYFRDPTAGVDYADQRYYQFGIGRFQTPDPSTGVDPKNPITWNKYAYAGDDPVNHGDPRGTCWEDASWGIDAGPNTGLTACDVGINMDVTGLAAAAAGDIAGQVAAAIQQAQGLAALAMLAAQRGDALRQQASTAIRNMSANCQSALGQLYNLYDGPTSLLAKIGGSSPNSPTFVDVSGFSFYGILPVAYFDPNAGIAVKTMAISDYLGIGGFAFALTSNGRNDILVGAAFDAETTADQNLTLIHEALHSYTGLGDVDLATKLGLGSFDNPLAAGTAIQNYLKSNCPKPQ